MVYEKENGVHLSKTHSEKAIFITIFAFAGFSISDVLRKIMSQDYEIIDILFWQAVCGMGVLLILAPFMGGVKSLIDLPNIKWHFVRGVLFALNTASALTALSLVPIVDAYTIFFLAPFVISILGMIFFKEAIRKHRMITIIVGFIGVLIAFRPGFIEINPAYFYALASVFLFSIAVILSRYIGHANGVLAFAFWPFLCLIVGIIIYKGGNIQLVYDGDFYIYMMVIGLVYSLGMLGLAYSYNIAHAAVLAPCQYVQILFGIAFDYLIWASLPDIYKIIGMVMVIGAGIYLFAIEKRKVILA